MTVSPESQQSFNNNIIQNITQGACVFAASNPHPSILLSTCNLPNMDTLLSHIGEYHHPDYDDVDADDDDLQNVKDLTII